MVYVADGTRLKKIETIAGAQDVTAYFGPVEIRHFGKGAAEEIVTSPHPNARLVNGEPNWLHRDQPDRRTVYRPFGEQLERIDDPTAAKEDKGFVGERYDDDAGLQYLNARYYDPRLALFIQPDWFEVAEPGVGTNRYAYCFGDPINCVDANGNQAQPTDPDDARDEDSKISRTETGEDSPKSRSKSAINERLRSTAKKVPGLLGLLEKGWTVAQALEQLNNDQNILYRGLSQRDMQNLLDHGAILPYNLSGNLTMEEHAVDSANSQYISLTTDRVVAKEFATSGANPSGLVAELDGQKLEFSGGVRRHDISKYGAEARGNVLHESEVLYEGRIPVGAIERIYDVPTYRGPAISN